MSAAWSVHAGPRALGTVRCNLPWGASRSAEPKRTFSQLHGKLYLGTISFISVFQVRSRVSRKPIASGSIVLAVAPEHSLDQALRPALRVLICQVRARPVLPLLVLCMLPLLHLLVSATVSRHGVDRPSAQCPDVVESAERGADLFHRLAAQRFVAARQNIDARRRGR